MVALPKPAVPGSVAPRQAGRRRALRVVPAYDAGDEDLVAALRAGRPVHRYECEDLEGPCPWVSCRDHLYLDVDPDTGTITLTFPELGADELDRMPETCARRAARAGGLTLEETAELLNVSRERVRQIEAAALRKLRVRHPLKESTDA